MLGINKQPSLLAKNRNMNKLDLSINVQNIDDSP